MEKVENGVLLTDREAAMMREILNLVSAMYANPCEDFLGYDFPDECKDADAMYFEMKCKEIGV